MTETEVIAILRRKVHIAGTYKAYATANGLSIAYVWDVLQGRRAPGGKILDALGLERVVTYREIKP